ncbi:EPIDERMAL PATTERNING FACTOR-like protein 4 [Malania oleifera]|uniref:EPIDERMAL PATTERNING FACTOR-like protein 4 n=1 Tax=Malania oleifera TaxID=397392 RepID=UPI0025AE727B|nr:EPIDERMAL PATTERNING FACTOR-like protein 4 [Malania oleifera]
MGVLRRRSHLRSCLSTAAAAVVAFALLVALSVSCLGGGVLGVAREEIRRRVSDSEVLDLTRRRLAGPGSSPPTCRSKCGKCTPCKPVHVPIQPGLSLPQEYYPEAWRCKCGDKLFMP